MRQRHEGVIALLGLAAHYAAAAVLGVRFPDAFEVEDTCKECERQGLLA